MKVDSVGQADAANRNWTKRMFLCSIQFNFIHNVLSMENSGIEGKIKQTWE